MCSQHMPCLRVQGPQPPPMLKPPMQTLSQVPWGIITSSSANLVVRSLKGMPGSITAMVADCSVPFSILTRFSLDRSSSRQPVLEDSPS